MKKNKVIKPPKWQGSTKTKSTKNPDFWRNAWLLAMRKRMFIVDAISKGCSFPTDLSGEFGLQCQKVDRCRDRASRYKPVTVVYKFS